MTGQVLLSPKVLLTCRADKVSTIIAIPVHLDWSSYNRLIEVWRNRRRFHCGGSPIEIAQVGYWISQKSRRVEKSRVSQNGEVLKLKISSDLEPRWVNIKGKGNKEESGENDNNVTTLAGQCGPYLSFRSSRLSDFIWPVRKLEVLGSR